MTDKKLIKDDELDNVTGGYIFKTYDSWYEIIDNVGNVVERFGSLDNAKKKCAELGYNTDMIDWESLYALREENGLNDKEQKPYINPYGPQ